MLDVGRHHGTGLFESPLKFLVGVLLNCLSVLKLLNEFHLKLLHAHHFVFFLMAHHVFAAYFVKVRLLDCVNAALAIFVNLHRCEALLLLHNLILHAVLLLDLKIHVSLLLVILTADDLSLFRFLLLRQEDGFLHFTFLFLSLLVQHVIASRLLTLLLILKLIIVDFLLNSIFVSLF